MQTAFIIEVHGEQLVTEIAGAAIPCLEQRTKAKALCAADLAAVRGSRVSVYRVDRRWQNHAWIDGVRELVYTTPQAIAA